MEEHAVPTLKVPANSVDIVVSKPPAAKKLSIQRQSRVVSTESNSEGLHIVNNKEYVEKNEKDTEKIQPDALLGSLEVDKQTSDFIKIDSNLDHSLLNISNNNSSNANATATRVRKNTDRLFAHMKARNSQSNLNTDFHLNSNLPNKHHLLRRRSSIQNHIGIAPRISIEKSIGASEPPDRPDKLLQTLNQVSTVNSTTIGTSLNTGEGRATARRRKLSMPVSTTSLEVPPSTRSLELPRTLKHRDRSISPAR